MNAPEPQKRQELELTNRFSSTLSTQNGSKSRLELTNRFSSNCSNHSFWDDSDDNSENENDLSKVELSDKHRRMSQSITRICTFFCCDRGTSFSRISISSLW